MNTKKIIPCLDTRDGMLVKGVNFVDVKEIGDPAEYAKRYEEQGADELVVLDITATIEGRKTLIETVKRTVSAITIPLSVGGGISSIEDFETIFAAGAAKVSVNSAAVNNPGLVKEASEKFGSERVIVAIDAIRNESGGFNVVINGGNTDTGKDAVEWAKEVERLGVGEILLTSRDADGTKDGYDWDLTKAVCDAVSIPVTASGGCGKLEDFARVFEETGCAAALAASLFHYGELTVGQIKDDLRKKGIPVIE